MEQQFNFLKLKIVRIFIIASSLIVTDATFYNDDYNFKYSESVESIPPLNNYPYGIPTPLSPPPIPSLPPLPSPAIIPLPPAAPSLTVPPPPPSSPNFPIKGPPGSFTPKPSGPPSGPPSGTGPSFPGPTVPPSNLLPPPPAHKKPQFAVWCVAKPTAPDSVIQAALDYACGFGAECKSIQPNGPCFQPNTLVAHASFAFNSYWQNNKARGGTCDFGGTALLVTVDPRTDRSSCELEKRANRQIGGYSKCSFIFK